MKSAYIPVPLYIINMGELGITIYCREIERLITTAYNTLVKSPKQDKSLANNQIVSLQQIKQIYEDNTATHKVNIANQMLYINDVKPFKFQIFKILSPRFKNDDSVICFQFIPFKLNTES